MRTLGCMCVDSYKGWTPCNDGPCVVKGSWSGELAVMGGLGGVKRGRTDMI